MRSHRRWIIVGLVAAGGVLLVAVGIQGLGKLLEAGKIPGELLTIRVRYLSSYTTAMLALGLTLIYWFGITGIARSACWKGPARAVHPSNKG